MTQGRNEINFRWITSIQYVKIVCILLYTFIHKYINIYNIHIYIRVGEKKWNLFFAWYSKK